MGRIFMAVVVALIIAFAIIWIAEMLTSAVIPPPNTETLGNPAAMREYMMNTPTLAYVMVAIGWVVAAFAGGFIVTKMSRRESPGMTLPLVVGGILTLYVIALFVALPHPIWFVVLGVVVFIPLSLVGHRTAR